ncbi:MAG: PIN domain-containing protein [archaeon]|nr:PIN domain-containing protein [archaeon]
MNPDSKNTFLDTNIIVYAFDPTVSEKHTVAKRIVEQITKGETTACISNQILAEMSSVLLGKTMEHKEQVRQFVESIQHIPTWQIVHYTSKTIETTLQSIEKQKDFWDNLIAQTMLENGITKIYTENTKDFSKIKGIKAVNPFR